MDTADGRLHLTPANLVAQRHRAIEARQTSNFLKYIFPEKKYFIHHPPLPNDENLFDVIQKITDCQKIGSFGGRVYRMLPNKGHEYSWHDDLSEDRLVALSINLSTEVYKGGILEIKDTDKNKIATKISNTGFGNAVFLHLAPFLKHRVTETIGKANRTVFAGWFHSNNAYRSIFKSRLKTKFNSSKTNKIKITDKSLVSMSRNLFFRNLNKVLIILDMTTDKCYSLDSIGAKVAKILSKPKTINELKISILNEFEVKPDKCERDLLNLLSDLKNNNIVSIN